jgi:hypothetical protein
MSTTTQSITPSQNTVSYSTWNSDLQNKTWGFKNRIINGAMVIDQRNAGASTTPSTTSQSVFLLDRWAYFGSQASKFTFQQNAGSVTPPAGFTNYFGATVASSVSIGSGDSFFISQTIEAFNTADLNFGSANAKTVTVSFWVRSSLTGTFGGALTNGNENASAPSRAYPFTYTISSANTWTQISVTIAGDTTGTWNGASNATGLVVIFGLGVGSTYSTTANSWAGGNYVGATGATSVVGTNGATFYITGVQLEVGSAATNFDVRSYGTELQLCQRYYETGITGSGSRYSDNYGISAGQYKVTKRITSPTVTPSSAQGGYYLANENGFVSYWLVGTSNGYYFTYTSSAEL